MSTQSITRKGFDYNGLPDRQTRATLRQNTSAIKLAIKRTHDNIIEIGSNLISAKEILEHGTFTKWIDAEFGMTARHAQSFMQVANSFSKSELNSLLPLPQTAIFMLAAPSVSEETRASAIEKAEAGEFTTVADVKAHIAESKVSDPPSLEEAADGQAASTASYTDDEDGGEPDFSVPPAEPGTPDEWNHPFADVDAEIEEEASSSEGQTAEGDSDDQESLGQAGESVAGEPSETLAERAQNAVIIHDTLPKEEEAKTSKSSKSTTKEEPIPDEAWLETLPIYRVLKTKQHRAIVLRRALLDYRKAEKAISAYSRAIASTESVKAGDNNFFAKAFAAPRTISTPDNWGLCAPCAGNGCTRCGQGGFEMSGGIDPRRVEAGETTL